MHLSASVPLVESVIEGVDLRRVARILEFSLPNVVAYDSALSDSLSEMNEGNWSELTKRIVDT